MEQRIIDDYEAKMETVLEELKNDFSEQIQISDGVIQSKLVQKMYRLSKKQNEKLIKTLPTRLNGRKQ